MMKSYFGFDDTDAKDSLYGTGKLVRWFEGALPEGCECLGVVRQQLFVSDEIPYTFHNSAACLIAEMPEPGLLNKAIESAANHLKHYAVDGSDPGLCVATEFDSSIESLIDFGHFCTRAVSTQKRAIEAAKKVHLSGHGGTAYSDAFRPPIPILIVHLFRSIPSTDSELIMPPTGFVLRYIFSPAIINLPPPFRPWKEDMLSCAR
jgi:hypothetical protein